MSRKFSISARHSGFMTYAERPALVLPGADAFRLPECIAFVMFFSFPPEGTSPPSTAYFTLSPFWCQGTGGQKNFPWPAAFVFGLVGGMVGRAAYLHVARHAVGPFIEIDFPVPANVGTAATQSAANTVIFLMFIVIFSLIEQTRGGWPQGSPCHAFRQVRGTTPRSIRSRR